MAINSDQQVVWTMQASEDLSTLTAGTGDLYKAIGTTGAVTASASTAIGVLQYGADDGGHITVCISGISKYVAGAAITAGAGLTATTSGYFTTASSGSLIVGRSLTAPASGSVGTGMFAFATPYYSPDSYSVY